MNINQSSSLSIDLFSRKIAVSGLLSSDQLLQEADILDDISLTPQQPSVPSDEIERLAHQLHDLVPLLKCVGFELDRLSKTQICGSMTLSHSMMNSPEGIENSPCLQIFTVAAFLSAITLAISFPKASMFCRGSVCDAPSVIFVKPQVQTGSGLWQDNRLQGRCSVDQDALLDQALIFRDRGHCDIQMYVQFFHCENPMAYASPTIALYRDSDTPTNVEFITFPGN